MIIDTPDDDLFFVLRSGRLYCVSIEDDKVIVVVQRDNKDQEGDTVYTFDRVDKVDIPKKKKDAYLKGYQVGFRAGVMFAQETMWELVSLGLINSAGADVKSSRTLH